MNRHRVDFNRPVIVGREMEYMAEAVANGHISGDGPFTKKVHALLEQELGIPKSLLTTSCTHALEMAAILLDIKEGDEVIIPDFTFVSTSQCFCLCGAPPRSSWMFGLTPLIWMNSGWRRPSRPAPEPSCLCIMPGSAARWTRSWRLPGITMCRW